MKNLVQLTLTAALLSYAALPAHAGNILPIGTTAQDLTLPSQDNSPVSLTDYKENWAVLYSYSKDMTLGCTIDAHSFQSDLEKRRIIIRLCLGIGHGLSPHAYHSGKLS